MIEGYKHFKPNCNPKANEENIIVKDNIRLTVIGSNLIRVEYGPNKTFQDEPSQTILNRDLGKVDFNVIENENILKVETDELLVNYKLDSQELNEDNFWITIKKDNKMWRYSDIQKNNLKGTITTLDNINGEVELPDGFISKDGWTIIDDSKTLIITEDGGIKRRNNLDNKDLYFIYYRDDYKSFLKDFFSIAGQSPMLPRYALGNWWSRYFVYRDKELLNLMDDFKDHDIPLSVCIVDMDWHTPVWWTGYSWNRNLFKNPKDFISKLHERGLKTALNLHPAQGLGSHEEMYEEVAEIVGMDPKTKETIEFNPDDENYLKGYFELMHHPKETEGIDFWWMDWQQEKVLKIEELEVLWWLNHIHYMDLGRDGIKRPMMFSRWSKTGNHRYPIGFSGDTIVSWESLAFQPYFTSTAANVGCFWWSHDIGGHMCGIESGEIFTRWVQFGVFSPIFRIHSAKNIFQDRRPWAYDKECYHIIKKYMNLRHKMIPYMYSINYKSKEGIPLVAPMYYYSSEEKAYHRKNQYYFGTELVVSPYVSEKLEKVNLTRGSIWLPEGEWFNLFNGEHFKGGRDYVLYGKLEEVPVFAKGGAIVPLNKTSDFGDIANPSHLELIIFPGASNSFELYEDDGETQKYLFGEYCVTTISQESKNNIMKIKIDSPKENNKLIPENRKYSFDIKGINSPLYVKAKINNKDISVRYTYIKEEATIKIEELILGNNNGLTIELETQGYIVNKDCRQKEKLKNLLMSCSLPNTDKAWIYDNYEILVENIQILDTLLEVPVTGNIKEAIIDVINNR